MHIIPHPQYVPHPTIFQWPTTDDSLLLQKKEEEHAYLFQYGITSGLWEFREELAKFLSAKYGDKVHRYIKIYCHKYFKQGTNRLHVKFLLLEQQFENKIILGHLKYLRFQSVCAIETRGAGTQM
jgi:hypothetical protein